ncbi:multidrug ABC transporter ATP-binding protein [Pseudoclavibacter endophyticus]|uniref:ATP-binding cassette domain-containing protein n=1 Tax=Pseudoclavibacter endophyticus TaxID=1778590 RepID=A0A6H9WFW4_9MICO|nr:ATP-binding cassette domain-containing protein [Pseudoclavibacter endophyticus]KAB1649792.1 ATP-binding cassette domain-containing protein [Pseudoclavibacter endophyticus]GGA59709.1 multidrug ABC transporter ATP-binding protein [Pseudoclavibacter endophyticus]
MIEIRGAGVVEGDVTLLAPTSSRVAQGGALVVRGPNGSGKSTLLQLVAGLRVPTTGSLIVAGDAPRPRSPEFRRRVAALVATPPLARDLTLAEHIDLVAATWSGPGRHVAGGRVLDELDLGRLATRFPHELSSGQQQLFTVALVLARPSEVLVFDEPEHRLDDDRVQSVAAAIAARRAAGATVVVATHDDAVEAGVGGDVLHLGRAAA